MTGKMLSQLQWTGRIVFLCCLASLVVGSRWGFVSMFSAGLGLTAVLLQAACPKCNGAFFSGANGRNVLFARHCGHCGLPTW